MGGFDSDLNRLALIGADIVITPVSNNLIELYGLEAFKKILKDIKQIRDIKVHILLNKINPRAIKVVEELKEFILNNREYFELLDVIIRYRNDYAKSFEEGKSVVELDKNSKASIEIQELINNIEIILLKKGEIMGKFDKLDKNFDEVVNKASLKENNKKDTKNILVYNVPKEWVSILKANGVSFSSYAKMAIIEKMKKDGLI